MALPRSENESSASITPSCDVASDGSETVANGSDTSYSTSDAYTEFLQNKLRNPGLTRAAIDFLSDLNNYLALGCLVRKVGIQGEDDRVARQPSKWEDVTHTPPLFPSDPILTDNLSKLAIAGWIRIQSARSTLDADFVVYRLFVLPGDVGLRLVDRQNRRLIVAFQSLVAKVDCSTHTWSGSYVAGCEQSFDPWATAEEGSLFYMFNAVPSPAPDSRNIDERYTKQAMEDLLRPDALPGLRTALYPYQRRSAGEMLQRESLANLVLDPRFEIRTAPDGSVYYYAPADTSFYRNARLYEACRGGILAETMGNGKTLMCLALILATRNNFAKVPPAYEVRPVRPTTGTLADMAVSAVQRKSPVEGGVRAYRTSQCAGLNRVSKAIGS